MAEGYLLEWFEDIGSTNEYALQVAGEGPVQKPMWIVAQAQHNGRGRRGRKWIGEIGNLFSTLLLEINSKKYHPSDLSFVAAVACADVCATQRQEYQFIRRVGI